MAPPLLSVRDLRAYFRCGKEGGKARVARAVDGVSFEVHAGQTVCLVGESGCGKSVTSLSIMRLLARTAYHPSGEVLLDGQDLLTVPERAMRRLRGNQMAMIFQEPMTSLNPIHRIGAQIGEPLRVHQGLSRKAARKAATGLLERVGISDPASRVDDYPHQMSGGMKQRAMIAMALACSPSLLVADEPTTALDVTIQAQILELLRDLQAELNMGLLLITHDLGVVAEVADEVVVMYAGRIAEKATAAQLFAKPLHPYTEGLFRALPDPDVRVDRLAVIPGRVPAATAFPEGCRFKNRCPDAKPSCGHSLPRLEDRPGGRQLACLER